MSVPQLKYRTTLRHPHAHLIVGFRPRTGHAQPEVDFRGGFDAALHCELAYSR